MANATTAQPAAARYVIKVTTASGTYLADKRTTAARGLCMHASPARAKVWTSQAAAAKVLAAQVAKAPAVWATFKTEIVAL